MGRTGPHAADSRARHSGRDRARRVRRPDSGARAVRHHVVRAGGRAGDRIRRRIPAAEDVRRLHPHEPADSGALAGFARFLPAQRHAAEARRDCSASPPWRKTLRELVAAEKKAHGKRAAKIARRARLFYKGPLAKRMADFSAHNGGLIAYDDLAKLPRRNRQAAHHHLSRLRGQQARLLDAGSGDARSAEYAGGLRPQRHGPQFAASICTRWWKR